MFFLLRVLPDDSVDHSLEDVFFRYYTLHVFNQVVSVLGLVVFEVVDDQVQSSFRHHID